ncbi:hypothetical protein PCE1_004368 [Barthelona sp. PCE]
MNAQNVLQKAEQFFQDAPDLYPGETFTHKIPNIKLLSSNPSSVRGSLALTSHRITFKRYGLSSTQGDFFINIPYAAIRNIQKVGNRSRTRSAYYIEIETKDFRVYRFGFVRHNSQRGTVFTHVLEQLSMVPLPMLCTLPVQGISSEKKAGNGWHLYNDVVDYHRMGLVGPKSDGKLVITNQNRNFQISPTYPPQFVIPRHAENILQDVCAFRSRARVPVATFKYNDSALWRSSQPCVGILNTLSEEDVSYLGMIGPTVFVLDCRPMANAYGNRATGKGFETAQYRNVQLWWANIENIHVMRESMCRVKAAVFEPLVDETTRSAFGIVNGDVAHSVPKPSFMPVIDDSAFYHILHQSGWLQHIRTMLQAAAVGVEVLRGGTSVLVHCSDGWDRTAQVCCLIEMCLDPFYRTSRGLCSLIEKHFITYGHKFLDRTLFYQHESKKSFGLKIGSSMNHKEKQREESPIFLQFIDGVYQLLNQFPNHFEFNQTLLIDILDGFFDGISGTFLSNTIKERFQNSLMMYPSLWDLLELEHVKYLNLDYSPFSESILPKIKMRNIAFWKDYYCRYSEQ